MKIVSNELIESLRCLVSEQARRRSNAESKITDLGDTVFEHLIKILLFPHSRDLNKHIREMNGVLKRLQRITLKGNKRIPEKDYYNWLYLEYREFISTTIKTLIRSYDEIPVRSSDEITDILDSLYKELSRDLSNNTFESLEDYL